MTAVEGGLSLFDNPTGFVDHLASLESEGELSEDQRRELLELVNAQYHKADDLLKPHSFTMRMRPNGRPPRGPSRSVRYSDEVQISESFLGSSYGRVEINIHAGEQSLMLSPNWQGKHNMRISFRGSLEDRRQLDELYIEDHFVNMDGYNAVLDQRGFHLNVSPFNLRQLEAHEGF